MIPIDTWHRSPRWLFPAAGACLLILLDALYATGLLPDTVIFPAMIALVLASLGVGVVLHDDEEGDRRADLPLTLAAVFVLLYVVKLGRAIEVLAVP
jgi:hypothetical protein